MRPHVLEHLDRPWCTIFIVAPFYLCLVVAWLARHDFDPSYFVHAGDFFVDAQHAPKNLTILEKSFGYDGQFYYRLALSPFTHDQSGFGVRLDSPRYRQQRILYPLLASLLSLGATNLVPWSLIFVNYLGVCVIGWLGGLYAQAVGRHALWGIAFALYAGFLLTLSFDLTEIVEVCLILASLVLIRCERQRTAAVLLLLAVLAKETALLVAVGALLSYLVAVWRGTCKQSPLLFALPVAGYLGWQAWLYRNWMTSLDSAIESNVGFPMAGFVSYFREMASLHAHHHQGWYFIEMCLFLLFTIAVIHACRKTTETLHVRFSWLLYLVLAFSLTRAVWVRDTSFLRALSEVYTLGVIIVLSAPVRLRVLVLSGAVVSCFIFATDVLKH
jgi:hypothetical protein